MPRNEQLFERAQRSIPGGVNSPVRAFRSVGGTPRFIDRAEGPYFWDADGGRYIDYIGSWGPMILGHSHPAVVKAVQEAAARGLSFGAPTEAEVVMAEELLKLVPSMEQVRLVSSGTEAAICPEIEVPCEIAEHILQQIKKQGCTNECGGKKKLRRQGGVACAAV